MDMVKDYGTIKVFQDMGHFVIYIGSTVYCTCDNWKEVREELRQLEVY